MRRRPIRTCDAPGCTVEVRRGILMCRSHWYALPRALRVAIGAAWRERRIRDWSANCLEARRYLADHPPAEPIAHAAVSAEQAYAATARFLGEREEGL